jgi:hypothetical protein
VPGTSRRHRKGPVLFTLTQLAYSRRFLAFGSLNQLLQSIHQAPYPVGAWLPCRFTFQPSAQRTGLVTSLMTMDLPARTRTETVGESNLFPVIVQRPAAHV